MDSVFASRSATAIFCSLDLVQIGKATFLLCVSQAIGPPAHSLSLNLVLLG